MLSTRQVCWHMHLAVQDGECTHPMVHRLSQLYNPRRSSSGIATNLVNLLEECEVSTSIVELPPGCICTHMVSPYRILQSLSVRQPADFPRIMGLRVELNRRFWEILKEQDLASFAHIKASIPSLQDLRAEQWGKVVPISLHEDAGPFSKSKSATLVSFSGLIGAGGDKLCQTSRLLLS